MRGSLDRLVRRIWAPALPAWARPIGLVLYPFGCLYAQAASLRVRLYAGGRRSVFKASVPVISLGNLVLGGTGKTPLAVFLARGLIQRGLRPAVLLRGYGGRIGPGPIEVRPDSDPAQVGDEAVLLAGEKGLIVVAGADRSAGTELAVRLGAEVIILDDGFQHLALARNLDLVLLDAARPLAGGRVFPAGPLREPVKALRRADGFILTRAEGAAAANQARQRLALIAPGRPTWTARHLVAGLQDPQTGRRIEPGDQPVLVAAGVARPDEVARSVTNLGWKKVFLLDLADHQSYTPAEVELINRRAAETGACAIVTTAKDWVKLARLADRIELPLWLAELEVEVEEEESLWRTVEEAASGRSRLGGMIEQTRRPLPQRGRLLIRAPNWIGDAIMAAPVLDNLRAQLPHWRLDLLAAPWVAPLFEADPCLDGLIVYHPQGSHQGLAGRFRLGRELAGRFDAGLLLPNSFDSALIFYLARLKRRVGYSRDLRRPLLTDPVPLTTTLRAGHMVEYYLGLLDYLGLRASQCLPRLHLHPDARQKAIERLGQLGLRPGERLIGLAPGAAFGPAKRWSPGRFVGAAKGLTENGGRVLIFGSAEESKLGREMAAAIGPQAVNLAGDTSLGEAMALIARLELLLSNDSGLAHLAAAIETPLLALFGPTDPARTGPRARRQRLIVAQAVCAPCFKPVCPKEKDCLESITVEEVIQASEELLSGEGD